MNPNAQQLLTPQSVKFNRFLKLIFLKQATFDVSQNQNTQKVACVQGESTQEND